MDITDRIQYLKECRHKEPEQLWRGFSDKFRLTVPSSWFDAIARSLDSLQEDSEYTTWAREMKEMLLSKRCQDWRAQYLQPRRSRLQGILQRSTAQESAGAIFNAQSMIRQARHVLSSSVQAELGGLNEPSPSRAMANEMNKDAQDLATDIDIHDRVHPFYEVFQALYDIAHNRPFVMPVEPTMQSRLQQRLFRFAVKHLSAFSNLPKLKQKDVYVAASSIVHLHMEDATQVIGEDLPELINRTRDSTLSNPPQFLIDILAKLKEDARKEDGSLDVQRFCLLVDKEIGCMAMKELDGTQVDDNARMIFEILRVVVPLCQEDAISRPNDTEQKSQSVWQRILEILFARTRISIVIGETGLETSKAERIVNETAHAATLMNTPVTPRKVDCKLVASVVKAKKWEFKPISNFEMKSQQAGCQQVEIQARKNMRLNHSISKKIPSTKLYFLDMHGYSAQLYCLWEYESVHVCGKVLEEELAIPTSEAELEWFMDGRCIAALLSLRKVAQRVQQDYARPSKTIETPRTPPLCPATTNHTFYTPKRVRSNSLSTAPNKKS
ncbi:hypothetical protein BGZ54_002540 [Gamsiella multidivaricata]|nr:hypothetical protein BGZ54_002540 [Gamsiella multidivaricata]